MKPASTFAATLVVALAVFSVTSAVAQRQPFAVPGEKLDSGLGSLPPYSQWVDPSGRPPVRYQVPGESIDDGLGELPPFTRWRDPSGRDPIGILSAGLTRR